MWDENSDNVNTRPTINTGQSTKNFTWSRGTVIYSRDTTKILKNKFSYTKLFDSKASFNALSVLNGLL